MTEWWITLAVGLVVAVVVVVLLQTLLLAVKRIDAGVEDVWVMGKQVAQNTATTWLLGQTPRIAEEIKDEALHHAALFTALEEGA